MYKKTITYKDFNDVERTEDFYFNLTEAEVTDMQLGVTGGLAAMIEKIIQTKDEPSIIDIFKKIIRASYGEKSPDGRRFMKSNEIWDNFAQTPAYSIFYMELAQNADLAAAFINGITPSSISIGKDSKVLPMNPSVE